MHQEAEANMTTAKYHPPYRDKSSLRPSRPNAVDSKKGNLALCRLTKALTRYVTKTNDLEDKNAKDFSNCRANLYTVVLFDLGQSLGWLPYPTTNEPWILSIADSVFAT